MYWMKRRLEMEVGTCQVCGGRYRAELSELDREAGETEKAIIPHTVDGEEFPCDGSGVLPFEVDEEHTYTTLMNLRDELSRPVRDPARREAARKEMDRLPRLSPVIPLIVTPIPS